MKSENLLSISPLDGRYNQSVSDLRAITSEFGLIKYRVIIEIKWFLHLSSNSKIKELPKLNIKEITYLNDLINNFDIAMMLNVSKLLRAKLIMMSKQLNIS